VTVTNVNFGTAYRRANISWHRVDEELHRDINEKCRAIGAFMDGRVTNDLMTEF
jgi:hypothetical protein